MSPEELTRIAFGDEALGDQRDVVLKTCLSHLVLEGRLADLAKLMTDDGGVCQFGGTTGWELARRDGGYDFNWPDGCEYRAQLTGPDDSVHEEFYLPHEFAVYVRAVLNAYCGNRKPTDDVQRLYRLLNAIDAHEPTVEPIDFTAPETVDIADGLGEIDIRGGEFDTMLLSHGKPVAINWHDCGGSIAQYLVRAGVSDGPQLARLRYTLDGNLNPIQRLSFQLQTFLQLLARGTYELSLVEGGDDTNFGLPKTAWEHTNRDFFYPLGLDIIATRPEDSLDEERIVEFEERIRSGERPLGIVMTTEEGMCVYLVDGHHKLTAYTRAGIGPHVILVRRMSPPELPPNTFDEHFSKKHPLASHYREWKRKWD